MSAIEQRLRRAARAATSARARAVVRRLAGRPLVAVERRTLKPVLSVVMPVYNVAAYLPEALDSVLTQTLREVEVIAVDDSSTDDCLAILRDYERRDARVRVLTQPNAGQGAARNLGVEVARGEFLTFVDSDDTVPPDAFGSMVASLRASGSDFTVGSVRRLHHGRFQRTAWQRTAHEADHLGVTLEGFPRAMQDILAHHRVFRTSFWRERVGGFRAHIAYEDHVPMLMAYVRAERFDSLKEVTYNWRIREDQTSTSQAKARLDNLRDRIEVTREAHELLRAEASDFVYDTWVGRVLELDLPPFLTHALGADDDYRALLAATFRTYVERATDRALDMVTVRQKLRGRLACEERWEELHVADDHFESIGYVPRATGRDGLVVAVPVLPFYADADERLLRLAPIESHHQGVVEHVEWLAGRVRVSGWVVRRGLAIEDPAAASLGAWIVSAAGETHPVPIEGRLVWPANVWGNQQLAAYQGGGFSLEIPLDLLETDSWHVEVETTYDGVTSRGMLLEHVRESAAVRPSGSAGVVARMDDARGLLLSRGDAPVTDGPLVTDVALVGETIVVQGLRDATLGPLPRVSGPGVVFGLLRDGRPFPSGRYELTAGGRRARVSPELAGRLPLRFHTDLVNVRVGQDEEGRVAIHVEPPLPPDALGVSQRRRLRDAYRGSSAPLVDAALLWGEVPRPDLPCFWTVADLSVVVPERATPVVLDSPEWYDALATCRFVVSDTDVGPWLRLREGQRYLRVFDDGPLEIGRDVWSREGLSEDQVRRETERRHAQWDTLLVPSPEVETQLRDQVGPLTHRVLTRESASDFFG